MVTRAILTSLGEGRRCMAAVLCGLDALQWKKPLSQTLKEVGRSRHSSMIRRMPVVPIARTFVSNTIDNCLLTFFHRLRGWEGRRSECERVAVMVKDKRPTMLRFSFLSWTTTLLYYVIHHMCGCPHPFSHLCIILV